MEATGPDLAIKMMMFYFEDHHGTEQTKKDNAGRNSHGISDHFQLEGGCGIQSQLFLHTYVALHILLHNFLIRVTYYMLHITYVMFLLFLLFKCIVQYNWT